MKFRFKQINTRTMIDEFIRDHDGMEELSTFNTRSDCITYLMGFVNEYVEHLIMMHEDLAEDDEDAAGSYSTMIRIEEDASASILLDGMTVFVIERFDETERTVADLYK